MKLDPDCIRDILFEAEEVCDLKTYLNYPGKTTYLEKYNPDIVLYHIRQCELSGLLYQVSFYGGGGCCIGDLTPQGHQFLSDIQSDTNWSKVKELSQNVGSASINVLIQIASNVITSLINRHFT